MTEKQEKILNVALKLFAEHGFHATSTNKIAKVAGVSEGLIFRHFEDKPRLLKAVLQLGHEKVQQLYNQFLTQNDPKKVILSIIELPFKVDKDQFHFWKLIYALKWQAEVYDNSISEPLRKALIAAFHELGYEKPVVEAEVVLIIIDGIATSVLLRKPENRQEILLSILKKYKL